MRRATTGPALILFTAAVAQPALAQCELNHVYASDAVPNEQFSNATAISGGTAIVGAHFDDQAGPLAGAAYILELQAGQWVETQKLASSDLVANDRFGWSVGISGDVAVVGTRYQSDFGYGSGSVYVFERNAGTWTETAKLVASDPGLSDFFGQSVAISGTTLVVGAVSDDSLLLDTGSAYVFEKQGGSWVETQKLLASDADLDDRFGYAVAIDGDSIMVSSIGDDDKGPQSGSVYVFERQAASFQQTQKLTGSQSNTSDWFGAAIDMEGPRAVISSLFGDGKATDTGAAYVFHRNGNQWSEKQFIFADDGASGDFFGHDVAISGDSVVAGAWSNDEFGTNVGAAYYYHYDDVAWRQANKLSGSGAPTGANIGYAVAIDGDAAILGARGAQGGTGCVYTFGDIGDVYRFGVGCSNGSAMVPKLTITGCATASGTVRLILENVGSATTGLLFLGVEGQPVPVVGDCVLYLNPLVSTFAVPLGPNGLDTTFILPATASAGAATLQAFLPDPTVTHGFTSSNGATIVVN